MIIKNNLQNINEIKLVMLDIDGTLVRFTNLEELMQRVFKEMNLEYKNSLFLRYVKTVSIALKDAENDISFNFETLCDYVESENIFKDKNDIQTFLSKMIAYEHDYIEQIEGSSELLETLKSKKNVVCSTNWFLTSQRSKLKRFNLDKYVEKIYTCENTVAKPNIHHFLGILNQEITRPSEAIMIGDSITDLPDSKIGLQSILFDPNNKKENLYEQATCVVTELNDITKLLGLSKTKEKDK